MQQLFPLLDDTILFGVETAPPVEDDPTLPLEAAAVAATGPPRGVEGPPPPPPAP